MSSDAPRARPALPEVDDRLAVPGTPYEVHDGELVAVPPADESHATRHSKIQAIIEAHVGHEFDVACDMLTRLTRVDDKAPDVSVFPLARGPNGRRQIEQLAFEVVSTQDIGRAGTKAAQLVARGVRRVFAIDVERSRALEWSATLGTWSVLDLAGRIEDPALDVPLSNVSEGEPAPPVGVAAPGRDRDRRGHQAEQHELGARCDCEHGEPIAGRRGRTGAARGSRSRRRAPRARRASAARRARAAPTVTCA